MILTYKIRHGRNFGGELATARRVAEFAVRTKSRSSADVRHFGLKSAISNQILKKYASNKTVKEVKSVKLTVPSQGVKTDGKRIRVPCLKLELPIFFPNNFTKINQIEVGGEFAYVSANYAEPPTFVPSSVYGVDRNTKGHCLVAANATTGKVLKLGKAAHHIHTKYRGMRRRLQKRGKFGLVKRIKDRESRLIRNLNHRCSKKLVEVCRLQNAGIVLEDLQDIRQTAKTRKNQRYSLNSWSFYQLKQMIEYKAKKQGVPVFYVEPQYTSQRCSGCGHIEPANRKKKLFRCLRCGKVEDADVNAGFNMSFAYNSGISRFAKDSDSAKGSTDAPQEALQ
jgi:putative transposase